MLLSYSMSCYSSNVTKRLLDTSAWLCVCACVRMCMHMCAQICMCMALCMHVCMWRCAFLYVHTHAGVVSLQCFRGHGLQTLVCRGKAGECSECSGHRGTPQQRCCSMQQGPVSVDDIIEIEDFIIYKLQEIHRLGEKGEITPGI